MSMYGLIVTCAGIQWNVPVTSCSGLIELLTITYPGRTAPMVSSVSTIRRVQMKERGGARGAGAERCTGPPAGRDQQGHPGDQEQEEQQEDRQRRARAEGPGEERR